MLGMSASELVWHWLQELLFSACECRLGLGELNISVWLHPC